MKLVDLEPLLYRYESRIEAYSVIDGDPETWNQRGCPTKQKTGPRIYRQLVHTLPEAQCVVFLCPKCFADGAGKYGCHYCEVTFADRGVAPEMGSQNKGHPTRWNVAGTGVHDLTTTPSIQLIGGCAWHGWITAGEIR